MNKFLVSVLLCASIIITISPMKRQRPAYDQDNQGQALKKQLEAFSVLSALQEQYPDHFTIIVCLLDKQSFSALNQACKASKQACDAISVHSLVFTNPTDAMCCGNANLLKRYLISNSPHLPLFEPEALQTIDFPQLIGLKKIKVGTFVCNDPAVHINDGQLSVFILGIDCSSNAIIQRSDFISLSRESHNIDGLFTAYFSNNLSNCRIEFLGADLHAKFLHFFGRFKTDLQESERTNLAQRCFQHFCFNVIFMIAAKKNWVPFIQVMLSDPNVFGCLSQDVLVTAAEITTDDEIEQMIRCVIK